VTGARNPRTLARMAPKIDRRPLDPADLEKVQRGLSLEPGEDTWGAVEDGPRTTGDADSWAGFEGAGLSDAALRSRRIERW